MTLKPILSRINGIGIVVNAFGLLPRGQRFESLVGWRQFEWLAVLCSELCHFLHLVHIFSGDFSVSFNEFKHGLITHIGRTFPQNVRTWLYLELGGGTEGEDAKDYQVVVRNITHGTLGLDVEEEITLHCSIVPHIT